MTDYATSRSASAGVYSAGHGTEVSVLMRHRRGAPNVVRGILYAHAAGQKAQDVDVWAAPLALGRRWPLLSCDYGNPADTTGTTITGGPYNWGNANAISRMTDAYNYLLSAAGGGAKSGTVGLFGGSMGAAVTLNWAAQNPTFVACLGLVIPAMNINDIYQGDRGNVGLRATIGGAYGVTYPTALPNIATNSPYDSDPTRWTGFPIKLWTGDVDPLAVPTSEAQTWAAAVNAAGGNVIVQSMGATVGHTTSATPTDDVVAFFAANMPA